MVNALRGSWLRPLAVPWMWTLEWRLLWMIFLWPQLLRQGRGASTALFQVALAQIRLGPLVGRVRALLRAHVDAHLSGSLLGQVPSDWLQARGRQRCGVCVLIRYPLWHPPNVPPCSPGGYTAGGTDGDQPGQMMGRCHLCQNCSPVGHLLCGMFLSVLVLCGPAASPALSPQLRSTMMNGLGCTC